MCITLKTKTRLCVFVWDKEREYFSLKDSEIWLTASSLDTHKALLTLLLLLVRMGFSKRQLHRCWLFAIFKGFRAFSVDWHWDVCLAKAEPSQLSVPVKCVLLWLLDNVFAFFNNKDSSRKKKSFSLYGLLNKCPPSSLVIEKQICFFYHRTSFHSFIVFFLIFTFNKTSSSKGSLEANSGPCWDQIHS